MGVTIKDSRDIRKDDGATLRRRKIGFGKEAAQALGEDQSKISEQPQGLAGGLEGSGGASMGEGGLGDPGHIHFPGSHGGASSPQTLPSPCSLGLRPSSELQSLGTCGALNA